MLSQMRGRFIVDVFNRDLRCIWNSGDDAYRQKMLLHSVQHYAHEMSLPVGHQSRMFSDEEYMLLIELYQAELREMMQLGKKSGVSV